MKTALILSLLFTAVSAQAEPTLDAFVKKVQNPFYAVYKLKKDDAKKKYSNRDFSDVLKPKKDFLAAIGTDLQRMYVTFKSVKKSEDGYRVEGTTKVKDTTCDFTGMIKPEKIREYKKIEHMEEDTTSSKDKAQGIFFGKFHFTEDETQKSSGVMDGYMLVTFTVTAKDKLEIDDVASGYSDWYTNNQYLGDWTPHHGTGSKPVRMGEYRVPDSGDLDNGAGEFHPIDKYKDKGWNWPE